MRSRKYRVVTTLERASNRLIRVAVRAGLAPGAFALLETTGLRTGLARHTPVGNGLDGDTFWLVAAHGTQADYVRNLQAEPRVRVRADGLWRAGTAVVVPGDDAAVRSRTLPHRWDAAAWPSSLPSADSATSTSKATMPPENLAMSKCRRLSSQAPLAVSGCRDAEHSLRGKDDLGVVFVEELQRIIALEEPAGALRPSQAGAHLDLQAHRRVGGIPGKVAASRPGNDDLTGCGHDLDAIDAERCPALEHLESFLHVRVDVLGGSVTGPRPGREHGQGFGCLRHELDAFS